jgi:CheY-like chemotaxis protein
MSYFPGLPSVVPQDCEADTGATRHRFEHTGETALPIRILIADDNASVRAAMRQVLESAQDHWEIVEAENGNVAVAKAQEVRPDLIIVDLVMPVMDGLTAAREIAKLLPDIPILMHTLYSSPQVKLEAETVGVRKTVAKSDSNVLISAVEELLHSRFQGSIGTLSEPTSSETGTTMRRTEDKIRDLCARLFATEDDEAHAAAVVELQGALHQHIQRLRERVAEYPVLAERRVRLPPNAARQESAGKKHQRNIKQLEPNNHLNTRDARIEPDNKGPKPGSI